MTPRGAACQKDSRYVRKSSAGNVKCQCFTCRAWVYTSAAQIREGLPLCRCGAGELLPASLEVCEELIPHRLGEHPDYAEEVATGNVKGTVRKSFTPEHRCGVCGDFIAHPRAHCLCGFDNAAGAYVEGSSRISEGGRRYVQTQPRRRWAEGERVTPIESVDLPF